MVQPAASSKLGDGLWLLTTPTPPTFATGEEDRMLEQTMTVPPAKGRAIGATPTDTTLVVSIGVDECDGRMFDRLRQWVIEAPVGHGNAAARSGSAKEERIVLALPPNPGASRLYRSES
jgi:hypothetical protein